MTPLLIQLALVAVFPLFGGHTLFKDGRSNYSIVVDRDASTCERTAATELSDCLFQMSGARLPVVEEGSGKGPAIHVGYTARTAAVSGQAKPEENDESFIYRSAGRDLLIWGGAGRGTMYGVFEEAQYQSPAAEFAELRAWVTAKLLWDPEQDTDALVRDFIAGYYGAPAPYIQEYFDKTQALVKDDTHFRIYFRHDDPLYTDRYITEATALLEKARAAAQSEREVDEVDKVRMQILYLKILRDRETSLSDGSYAEFLRIARKTGTRISERFTLEQFLEKNFPERAL